MKITITAIITLLLSFPVLCAATYVIHLKDGRSFTTPEYREEGDQIKIERYGGVIGLPKDQIIDIEEIADVPKEKVLKPPENPPVPENRKEGTTVPKSPSEDAKTEGEKSADPKKKAPQAVFIKEKQRILVERERISKAFEEAKRRNHRKEKDLYWNELIQIQNKLKQLRDRVAAQNNGVLPPWWEQFQ